MPKANDPSARRSPTFAGEMSFLRNRRDATLLPTLFAAEFGSRMACVPMRMAVSWADVGAHTRRLTS